MYDFKMSKVNVRNIKNDTREEGSDSYLGRNCYFATLGNEDKYMCEFVKSDDGQFFQK